MINVIGILHHANDTEYRRGTNRFDVDFILDHAQAYDENGYDRVLIGQHARAPDSLSIAAFVAANTRKLKFMIAHRPGFVAPTMAARMFATLDRLSDGRCAAHIITASSDVETRCDGDFLTKADRYRRSLEYVQILRAVWAGDAPADHRGEFYRFDKGFCDARPLGGGMAIWWGGASDLGVEFGARCADVYAMGGGPLARTSALVSRVRSLGATHRRAPEFCMSMRVVLAQTESAAWARARSLVEQIVAFREAGGVVGRDKGEASRAAMAQARAAMTEGDPRLWNGVTLATDGRTHAATLVGDPDQITAALMRYHVAGVQHFILTGFDPLPDTLEIGRSLIPRLKAAAALVGG